MGRFRYHAFFAEEGLMISMGARSSLTALSHAGVGFIHGLTACWGLDYRSVDGFLLDVWWRMCHYLAAACSVPHAFLNMFDVYGM